MSDEEKDFVIKDRRIFATEDEEGEMNESQTEASPEPEEPPESEPQPESQGRDETAESMPLPEINFATFVFSLSSSAMLRVRLC